MVRCAHGCVGSPAIERSIDSVTGQTDNCSRSSPNRACCRPRSTADHFDCRHAGCRDGAIATSPTYCCSCCCYSAFWNNVRIFVVLGVAHRHSCCVELRCMVATPGSMAVALVICKWIVGTGFPSAAERLDPLLRKMMIERCVADGEIADHVADEGLAPSPVASAGEHIVKAELIACIDAVVACTVSPWPRLHEPISPPPPLLRNRSRSRLPSARAAGPDSDAEAAAAETPKSPPTVEAQAASSTVTTRRLLKRARASSRRPILVAWRGSSMRRTSLSWTPIADAKALLDSRSSRSAS